MGLLLSKPDLAVGEGRFKSFDLVRSYEYGHAICTLPSLSLPLRRVAVCPVSYLSDILNAQQQAGDLIFDATLYAPILSFDLSDSEEAINDLLSRLNASDLDIENRMPHLNKLLDQMEPLIK